MLFVGIDLSGPSNTKDTALAITNLSPDGLELVFQASNFDDLQLLDKISHFAKGNSTYIFIDAPLSYNQGGGLRDSDKEFRDLAFRLSLPPTTIMPPTFTKMGFLTLRGIFVSNLLRVNLGFSIHIAETHPGISLALEGIEPALIKNMKSSVEACNTIAEKLSKLFNKFTLINSQYSDHDICSIAASLSAKRYFDKKSALIYKAKPPAHPYNFIC